MSRAGLLFATLVLEGLFLALAIVLAPDDRGPFSTVVASVEAVALGVIVALPLVAGIWLLLSSEHPGLRQIQTDLGARVKSLFSQCTWVDFALISVMAGVGEEALFRGFAQVAAADAMGVPMAIVAVSIVFGAVHAISKWYFLYATVMGAILGILFVLTGNLLTAIIAHTVYDFLGLMALSRLEFSEA